MAKIELLAPAGGPDSLDAAIRGGADAVYLGGTLFNARMNAGNFTGDEFSRAVGICHENGVRVYVTLNTLLFDRKLPEALAFAESCYRAGADAAIVTDPGLISLLRRDLPDWELHASTQLSSHNALAGAELQKMGVSRLVCARELSKENIRALCAASPIPVEMFVHGAICACHSGQCLFSSVVGGRSGNRGECAQPCRLPYNGSYPLSFKDLCLARHVREILSLGVASLKIEGRMKSPAYVYSVTSTYRRLIDEGRDADPAETEKLARVFSRSGFTDGYFTGRVSSDMLGVRREEDKKQSERVSVRFDDRAPRRAPIRTAPRESRAGEVEKLPFCSVKKERTARFFDPASVAGEDFFDHVYLPLDRYDPALADGFFLPDVIPDGEISGVEKQVEKAAAKGAKRVLVGNFGHLALVRGKGLSLHGDFRFNVTNSYSAAALSELEDLIVSPELNLAQLRDLAAKKSVIVYGRLPLMLLEKRVGAKTLSDRRGVRFPVIASGGRDLVLNSVPLYMGDRQAELKKDHLLSQHFLFTVESRREAEEIIRLWREEREAPFPVRRIK